MSDTVSDIVDTMDTAIDIVGYPIGRQWILIIINQPLSRNMIGNQMGY